MNRRASVLREMGLAPLWRLRDAPGARADSPPAEQHAAVAGVSDTAALAAPVRAPAAAARPAAMPAAAPLVAPAPAHVATDGLDWEALEAAIGACRACPLHERRTMAVPGVGDRAADWLFVGEGPGAEEDLRGEPFVGQAGKLLDAMLAAIGLARGRNVYIANAVKCRPPGNRTPEAAEMATCQPYLERQIALIQPRIIVALGRPAAQTLLGGEVKINAARGRLFDRAGIPVVVTYHPAYLLRSPQDKAKAWEDLCFARAALAAR
ncbi:uracil-DNA glycosylase, 4 family protein [Methyloversatilis sp. RAC08]|uniref:uracil-DNA glycosylase n=1 Tax=Methyloversatilis sp. RAC08 TaxID=1842540 RepID=UPI00083D0322|nr:uracil-DNA glycosylase [Methyloversatilis sp. RAC08]AOF81341.1 uracil-DNA glycosylase, 4 family protein [Methyloversatilis sp. RAC08]